MNANDLYKSFEGIDDETLAASEEEGGARRARPRMRWLAIAASLVLIVGLGLGGFSMAAQAKEYRKASAFFEENGLPTEGLTRSEIVAVYRDITTESFTYGKTAEVIVHRAETNGVPGWELAESGKTLELDHETLVALWRMDRKDMDHEDVWYDTGLVTLFHDEGDGWYEETGSYIEKYDGKTLLWRKEFDGIYVSRHTECVKGVFVAAESFDASYYTHTSLILLDFEGNELWRRPFGATDEDVYSVLAEEDGSVVIFSRPGEHGKMRFTRVGGNGETLFQNVTETGNYGFYHAAHYKDGYIVQLYTRRESELACFAKVDKEGNITERYNYSSDDAIYALTDLIEFGGRIYMSVYAVPKDNEPVDPDDPLFGLYTSHNEVAPVIAHMEEQHIAGTAFPDLTEEMRERYTALLMVLDPENGDPIEFYSVKGGMGGRLAVENGELVWDFEDIRSAAFSPATNSFSVCGMQEIIRYRFLEDGQLASMRETGEYKAFYR